MAGIPDRVVETIARLNRYTGRGRASEPVATPIAVAVSRQAGSRGAAVARAAGAALGWPVYDHELLELIAREKGTHAALLESVDERYVGWIEEAARLFSEQKSGYLSGLRELLLALGKLGHCVVVGRGAPHILPAETTLRVRVVAPHASRVAHVQASKGVPAAEAERWVDRTDRERNRFLSLYFQTKADNPVSYDLVLNSERLSVEGCAAVVVQQARRMEAALQPAAAGV
jgi:cytidylate kinase